jgi:hypothetical protein
MRSKLWSTAAITFALVSLTAAQGQRGQDDRKKTSGGEDIITVVGCVQKEADYRSQKSDGRGGAANTGIGVANEFVLRSAKTVDSTTLKPINTGEGGYEVVYSLTGKLEGEVQSSVGQQVAVTGYVERANSNGTQKVKDLPMLNAQSWRKVGGSCK